LSKPVNVSVEMGGRIRSVDQLIRKFLRCCKEEGFLRDVRSKSRYESKSEKRRRKKHVAIKRASKKVDN